MRCVGFYICMTDIFKEFILIMKNYSYLKVIEIEFFRIIFTLSMFEFFSYFFLLESCESLAAAKSIGIYFVVTLDD